MCRVLGLSVVLLVLTLPGCGGDEPPAQEPTREAVATPKPKVRAAPKVAAGVSQTPSGEKISVELWANGRVRVRRGPDRSFEIARLTTEDEHFWAVEKRNGWYRLEGQRSHWVYKSVVRLTELQLGSAETIFPVDQGEERVEADDSFSRGAAELATASERVSRQEQALDPTPTEDSPRGDAVLHVQGSRYFHTHEDCSSKEAPTARHLTRAEAEAKGLRECRVCRKR